MRKQYTSICAHSERDQLRKKKRVYAEAHPCEYCKQPFQQTKDRKRFCSRGCFQQWERERLKTSATAGVSQQSEPLESTDEANETRSSYWLSESQKELCRQYRSKSSRMPLILTGHGVDLRVKSGALMVKDGLTHYPQNREEFLLFPGKQNTPSRIVLLSRSGSVSVDAICWLSAQDIPLIIMSYQGDTLSCVCPSCGPIDYELRKVQETIANTNPLQVARALVGEKIQGCISNVLTLTETNYATTTAKKLATHIQPLEHARSVNEVMVLEAAAACTYFNLWQHLELKWKKASKVPTPTEWLYFGQRESKVSGTNRHASQPVNAILNYAYAVLESQVRIAATALGFDLKISFLHSIRHGRESLIYDFMEPLRPKIELKIIQFLKANTFDQRDFSLSIKGICRLNPQLARRIALLTLPHETVLNLVAKMRSCLMKM
jgi:CRISP-associated protein Cas1